MKGSHLFFLFLTLFSVYQLMGFTTYNRSTFYLNPDPKDTVKAVVTYGNDFLYESAVDFSTFSIQQRVDSLIGIDSLTPIQLKELDFYKSVAKKTEAEMYQLVDSLFELDTIPYSLINQINLFVALMPTKLELPEKFEVIKEDGSIYPSNEYYETWNSREAFNYPVSITQKDSTLVLVLTNKVKNQNYHHPLCQKTLTRYMGTVTSPYGWRDDKPHQGVDLEVHLHDSILCAFDGKVRLARNYDGYGKVVIVRHYNGLETLYAHLNKIKVKDGDVVKAGHFIGTGGMTGNASGTHLHFEIRFKGIPLNPAHIISFQDRALNADTLIVKKIKSNYIVYPYNTNYHIVKKGESLYTISKRYGIKMDRLCDLNMLAPKTKLIVGQRIKIYQQ